MLKRFINHHLIVIALFSLVVALIGVAAATPNPASASTCYGMSPVQCSLVTVQVYDTYSNTPIDDAKVALIDPYGNVTYAYNISANPVNNGNYVAYVTPGYYRVLVTAPNYYDLLTNARVEKPGEEVLVKAPLLVNSVMTPQ